MFRSKKVKHFFSRRLQELDQFGYPIHLTFSGEQHYRTKTGGIVSILIFILSILYAGVRFIYMVTKSNPSITRNQQVRGFDNPEQRYFDPFTHGFFFLVRADYTDLNGKNLMMTPDLGTIKFSAVSRLNNNQTSKSYPMIPCTQNQIEQLKQGAQANE